MIMTTATGGLITIIMAITAGKPLTIRRLATMPPSRPVMCRLRFGKAACVLAGKALPLTELGRVGTTRLTKTVGVKTGAV